MAHPRAHQSYRWAVAGLALGLLVGACETTVIPPAPVASAPGAPQPPAATPPARTEPVTAPSKYGFAFRSSGDPRFDTWRDEFGEMVYNSPPRRTSALFKTLIAHSLRSTI